LKEICPIPKRGHGNSLSSRDQTKIIQIVSANCQKADYSGKKAVFLVKLTAIYSKQSFANKKVIIPKNYLLA